MKKIFLHLLFLVIVAGDLVGEFTQDPILDHLFKPLIMIWIAGYFFLFARDIDQKIRNLAFVAFLSSWAGDVLLMYTGKSDWFFIAGIAGFLAVQISYSFLFLRTIEISGRKSFLKKSPAWFIPYLAYGFILYILLYPHLDTVLKAAVFIYILAILGMATMALNRYGNGHPISFSLVFAGSLFFMLSDTLIAVNRFMVAIPYEGLLVMPTYILAQYLIMRGLLKQYE